MDERIDLSMSDIDLVPLIVQVLSAAVISNFASSISPSLPLCKYLLCFGSAGRKII